MSLNDEVLYFTFHWRDGQFGHVHPPARCLMYSICCQPSTRTRNN